MKKLIISVLLLGMVLAPLGAGVAFAQAAGAVGATIGLFGWHDALMSAFAEIGNIVLTIVSKVLDLAGAVLNFSIDLTVNMGEFLNKVKIVEVGWTVFRDLANLFFIFVLLWLGLRMILGFVGSQDRKTILWIIVMALLINFSLFITKAVVDAGNIATLHFYNAMRPDLTDPSQIDPATGQPKVIGRAGLSDIYMEALKLQTVYDPSAIGTSDAVAAAGGFASQFIKVGLATLLGSVFFLVAAFVFFAAGIMFISRAVILMFLMLISPLAFVAQILPNSQAQGLGKQWWNTLFKQTFWAPLYMALTYAVAKAIQSGGFRDLLNITGNEASFAALMSSPASDNVGIIVNYIILIVVMMATLIIASKWGAYGSGMVMEWGQKARKWGQGVAGRNTLGRLGETWDKRLGDTAFGKSALGKTIRGATTGALYGAKFGSGASRKGVTEDARKEAAKSRREELDVQRQDAAQRTTQQRRDTAQRAVQQIRNMITAGTSIPQTVISGMSNEVIAEMDPALLADPHVATALSAGQLQRLNDTLTTQQRTAIRNAVLPPGVISLPPMPPFSRAAYDFMTTGPGVLW